MPRFTPFTFLSATVVAAAVLVMTSRPADAVGEVNEIPAPFAFVGFTPGETLRLSAANVAQAGTIPSGSCRVQLAFVNEIGGLYAIGAPLFLDAGASAFLDLPFERLGSTAPRVDVRPVGLVLPVRTTACPIAFSVQGIDQTSSKTLFVFDPQPDPPGKQKVN